MKAKYFCFISIIIFTNLMGTQWPTNIENNITRYENVYASGVVPGVPQALPHAVICTHNHDKVVILEPTGKQRKLAQRALKGFFSTTAAGLATAGCIFLTYRGLQQMAIAQSQLDFYAYNNLQELTTSFASLVLVAGFATVSYSLETAQTCKELLALIFAPQPGLKSLTKVPHEHIHRLRQTIGLPKYIASSSLFYHIITPTHRAPEETHGIDCAPVYCEKELDAQLRDIDTHINGLISTLQDLRTRKDLIEMVRRDREAEAEDDSVNLGLTIQLFFSQELFRPLLDLHLCYYQNLLPIENASPQNLYFTIPTEHGPLRVKPAILHTLLDTYKRLNLAFTWWSFDHNDKARKQDAGEHMKKFNALLRLIGVQECTESTSREEVRKKYKQAAFILHPDKFSSRPQELQDAIREYVKTHGLGKLDGPFKELQELQAILCPSE